VHVFGFIIEIYYDAQPFERHIRLDTRAQSVQSDSKDGLNWTVPDVINWVHLFESVCIMLLLFPPQHWLGERTSALRHTYIACLVMCITNDFDARPRGLSGAQPDTRTGFP